MVKNQEASKSKVIAVRLPDDEARRTEARAQEKGLTKSEYLASLVRRDLADALKISDDLARRIEARAYERGETRAEYLTRLIKADLEKPHEHHTATTEKAQTSWLSFFSRGHTRRNKRRHGKRAAETKPSLAELIVKGFQPLADPQANQDKKPEEGSGQAEESEALATRARTGRRPARHNVEATPGQPHGSVAVRAEPVSRP